MDNKSDVFCQPGGIYLLSHSIGLAPRQTREYVAKDHFGPWERNTENAWPSWLEQIGNFRAALARLFGHRAEYFCPQSNVSSATTKILYSLPRHKVRKSILLTEQAFPSLGFVFQKAVHAGYDVKFIGRDEDSQDPDVWVKHLTPDIGFVLITHAHSNDGRQIPVRDVVGLVRERSAISIVDIAQSAGVLPIDLADWNADFVVGSCIKWLCGGPGAGFLWANPEILPHCEPTDVGWFSHSDPFEFDIHNFQYAEDALRFWGGTPSVLPYVVARRSIELIDSIGVETIRAHNVGLSNRLIAAVDDGILVSPRVPERRSGTVIIDAGNDTARLTGQLQEANVQFDRRGNRVRMSPHIYNSADDIDTVIDSLKLS